MVAMEENPLDIALWKLSVLGPLLSARLEHDVELHRSHACAGHLAEVGGHAAGAAETPPAP